jgi:hypothetical protein
MRLGFGKKVDGLVLGVAGFGENLVTPWRLGQVIAFTIGRNAAEQSQFDTTAD